MASKPKRARKDYSISAKDGYPEAWERKDFIAACDEHEESRKEWLAERTRLQQEIDRWRRHALVRDRIVRVVGEAVQVVLSAEGMGEWSMWTTNEQTVERIGR